MSETTKIEWADSTFNPWIGCTKISPGCDHCYAEADFDLRKHRVRWGAGNPRSRTSAANWKLPLQWNDKPYVECMSCRWRGELGVCQIVKNPPGFHPPGTTASICPQCSDPMLKAAQRRVFCASLADVFDSDVPPQWRVDLLELIAKTPNLIWMLLTKRIGNVHAMLDEALGEMSHGLTRWEDAPWPNVWIGATIVNQVEADRDVPKLLKLPAHVRFLSCEPLLGPVDLTKLPSGYAGELSRKFTTWNALLGTSRTEHPVFGACDAAPGVVDWVIGGGESGSGARRTSVHWVRSLRDQCAAAGTPFLFKQWGEWLPDGQLGGDPCLTVLTHRWTETDVGFAGPEWSARYGKKLNGRLLDGREHNEFP